MILVLCANAGIDRTYEVSNFAVGGFHHPGRVRVAAGGKGINVARALRSLGQAVTVTGFVGGGSGQFIEADLRELGAHPAFVRIAEESRLCINIVDPFNRQCTRVDELGPLVSPSEVKRLSTAWRRLLGDCQLAIISGSAPRGVPFHLYRDLVHAARQASRPIILDAHDEPLKLAIEVGPDVVKPNHEELEKLMRESLSIPDGIVKAGRELVDKGVKMVLVSLAEQGAIGVTAGAGIWRVEPPPIEVVNPVGGGDAMVAGLAAATIEGQPFGERLQWAVAAGTVSAQQFGAAACSRADVEALAAQVRLTRLDK